MICKHTHVHVCYVINVLMYALKSSRNNLYNIDLPTINATISIICISMLLLNIVVLYIL